MHYECCAYVPLKTSGGPRRAGFLVFKVRIGLSTKSNSISNPTWNHFDFWFLISKTKSIITRDGCPIWSRDFIFKITSGATGLSTYYISFFSIDKSRKKCRLDSTARYHQLFFSIWSFILTRDWQHSLILIYRNNFLSDEPHFPIRHNIWQTQEFFL